MFVMLLKIILWILFYLLLKNLYLMLLSFKLIDAVCHMNQELIHQGKYDINKDDYEDIDSHYKMMLKPFKFKWTNFVTPELAEKIKDYM